MTTAILVARMGSSRFPGKSMQPILGKPMLERMFERVAPARSLDRILLATTHRPEDDALAALAARLGIGCTRGSSEDVLGRLQAAAQSAGAQTVVELLGDNPLVHADLIDDVVAFYRSGSFDYAASATTEYPEAGDAVRKFPIGIRVQVHSRQTLDRCARLATEPADREHSTRYILLHPEQFRIGLFEATGRWAALNRPELTFAVNLPGDLRRISRIFQLCWPRNPNFTLHSALQAAEAGPVEVPA